MHPIISVFVACVLIAVLLPLGNACSKMELNPNAFGDLSSVGLPVIPGGDNGPPVQINDTFFPQQWTFQSTGQLGTTAGQDANVVAAWRMGNIGSNVLVSVVDDGAELNHPDIRANLRGDISFNYNTNTTDPTSANALHGTCVSGIIAGEAGNGFGITGVAPGAKIAAYNFLESDNTDLTETDAMTRNAANVAISNNSWGPGPAGYGYFRDSSAAWKAAIESGLTTGRGGLGTVYIFAAGNGALSPTGEFGDQANLNGYANFYGVVSVCAVDERGATAYYSEPGASLWVCAPSGSGVMGRPAVTTTDMAGGLLGYNLNNSRNEIADKAYTQLFSGTSAAAPLVSGVVALILKERPTLSWRDVKWILARSARRNDAANTGWAQNAAAPAFNIHYDYGFGVVDAGAAVALARTWTPVGPMRTFSQSQAAGSLAVNDAGAPATSSMTVAGSGIARLEYVEVTVDVTHQDWGNLDIELRRNGLATTSRLAIAHKCLGNNENEIDCAVSGNRWRFGSSRHLGETGDGTWTLVVRDGDGAAGRTDNKVGTFTNWQIRLFGESQ